MEVHDAADPALAHEREGSSEVWREPGIPAYENDRTDEGVKLVDEIGVQHRRGEVRSAHRERLVALQVADSAFSTTPAAGG